MTDLDRQAWRALWQQLAQRNSWELVRDTDEEAFLDDAVAEWQRLQAEDTADSSPRIAILRVYSRVRFRCFCKHSNQAMEEILTAIFRIARRLGWEVHDAEDLAQETTERMYRDRHKLKQPEMLNTWMYRMFQNVERDFRRRTAYEAQMTSSQEKDQRKTSDESQNLDLVEEALLSDTIAAEIRAIIPKERERIILLRVLLWNEKPRDIARDLGLDLAYTRMIKSRTAKRLSRDQRFKTLLHELLGENNLGCSTEEQPE